MINLFLSDKKISNLTNLNLLFLLFANSKNKKTICKNYTNFFIFNLISNKKNLFLYKKYEIKFIFIFNNYKKIKNFRYVNFYKSTLKKNIKFKFNPLLKNSRALKFFKSVKKIYIKLNSFKNNFYISLNLKTSFYFYCIFKNTFNSIFFLKNYYCNFKNFSNNFLKNTTKFKYLVNFNFKNLTFSKNKNKLLDLFFFKNIFFLKFNYLNIFCFFYKINFFLFKVEKIKKININYKNFITNLFLLDDAKSFYNFKSDLTFFSNKYLASFFNLFEKDDFYKNNIFLKNNSLFYTNYYPIFLTNKKSYKVFFTNYKNNYNLDFVLFTNKFVISFMEVFFKKFIFIKYKNNYYNNIENMFLKNILNNYKKFQPAYWKKFLVKDFINILWYSFFLKDLTMISNWISIFMETLNFKNHKKFVNFFLNFSNKHSDIFIDILKIKGFFFDIRGKVGVTGSSKKRHIFFKFGSLKKSSKKIKINFNQNLVRTYSGVMGLTYIISY